MQLQNATGVMSPFSSMKLTIQWQPTIPGQVANNFVLSFDDEDSDDVSFCILFVFKLIEIIL